VVAGLLDHQTGLPAVESLLGSTTGAPGLLQGLPLLGGGQDPAGALHEGQALTSALGPLGPLLGPDSLVGTLLGGGLGLNSLVRATDVASDAAVQPASG